MIFRRITRRRPIATSMVAGGTLVAMAVFGWGVPAGDLARATWLSLLMVALLIIPAAIFALFIVLFKRYKKTFDDTPQEEERGE